MFRAFQPSLPKARGRRAGFQVEVAAHQRWNTRLRDCIDGTSREALGPRIACQDSQCVLGKWINGQGVARFGAPTSFAKLKATHAEFHICASEVLAAVYVGKKAAAEEKIADEFTRLFLRVQKDLSLFFLKANNEAKD